MSGRPSSPRRVALLWVLALGLVALATHALASLVPPFVPGGPAVRLWPPASAADPLQGWTVERGSGHIEAIDGVLRLEAPRADPYVTLRRPLEALPGTLAFALAAEVRFAGTGGLRPWQAARIHLLGRDAAGRLLPDPLEDAFAARADRDWRTVEATLALPRGAETGELLVRLQRAAGRLELRSLEVRPLVAAAWLSPLRAGLALLWLAVLAAGGLALLRAAARRPWAAAALAAAAIGLLLILIPPELAQRFLALSTLDRLLGSGQAALLGHAGLAALIAFLAARAVALRTFPGPALLVLVVAAAGESLQHLSLGRDPSLLDALANATGGLAGLLVARLLGAVSDPPAKAPVEEPERAEIALALPLVPLAEAERGAP